MGANKRLWEAQGNRPARRRGRGAIRASVSQSRDTMKLLEQMPDKLVRKALPPALRKAGTVVARQARANLRAMPESDRTSGKHLHQTITTRTWRGRTQSKSITGARYGDGPHAHLLEFGFLQKWVRLPLTGGVKVKRKTPKQVRPKPWLRPAADTTKQQQHAALTGELKRRMSDLD